MEDQRTSGASTVEPVTDGQAELLERVIFDAMKSYPGGKERAELAKGHPDLRKELWGLFDKLSADQALRLPLMERPVWMTLNRTCDDAKAYTADLKAGGFRISDWSADIMKKPGFKKGFDIDSVDLVSATGTELTGKSEPTTAEIFEGIRKAGGDLLPAWTGPELRKQQHPDQPNGEVLVIAMEPIADSVGDPSVFRVAPGDGARWLDTRWGYPDNRWRGGVHWVFRRRK